MGEKLDREGDEREGDRKKGVNEDILDSLLPEQVVNSLE